MDISQSSRARAPTDALFIVSSPKKQMMLRYFLPATAAFFLLCCSLQGHAQRPTETGSYVTLLQLFEDWRFFETPPVRDGAPDYTAATFSVRQPIYEELRERLMAIDTSGWAVPQRVDWTLVWAEMNGYDFNQRVLQPWARDPAFYKSLWTYRSDVPAHEGPTHHRTTEI